MISEFKHTVQLTVPSDLTLPDIISGTEPPPFAGLPIGSKLIRFQHVQERGSPDAAKLALFGVFRTPEEFLEEARGLCHPYNIPVSADLDNLEAMSRILQLGKLGTMKYRLRQALKYRKLASSPEEEEKQLHNSMQSDVRAVMASKRWLLFKQMMEDAAIVDENLFSEMKDGFRLTGQLES